MDDARKLTRTQEWTGKSGYYDQDGQADAARAAAAAEEAGGVFKNEENEDGGVMDLSISRLPQGLLDALMALAQLQKLSSQHKRDVTNPF